MSNDHESDKSHAFCRILGYFFSSDDSLDIFFEHPIDFEQFSKDVQLVLPGLSVTSYSFDGDQERVFLELPLDLAAFVLSLDFVHSYRLPAFLLESSCPLSLKQEFIASFLSTSFTHPSIINDVVHSVCYASTSLAFTSIPAADAI